MAKYVKTQKPRLLEAYSARPFCAQATVFLLWTHLKHKKCEAKNQRNAGFYLLEKLVLDQQP